MAQIAVDDIIVLIPGIMGSVLADQTTGQVWALTPQAFLNALTTGGQDLLQLKLINGKPGNIVATKLFEDTHLIPGFWTIDGYTAIRQSIQANINVSDQNYFEFPYDWRLDNRLAAQQLKQATDGWLSTWRKIKPDAKLIFLVHSMGGLVARYFIETLGGWQDTRLLISFAAPYHGSMKALDCLVNGAAIKPLGITLFDFSPVVRSFPAAYQLLPMYDCLDTGAGPISLKKAAAAGQLPPNLDPAMVQDAINFYDEMATAVAQRLKGGPQTYQIKAIVGTEQTTELRALLAGGNLTFYNDYPNAAWTGDTTVPWISAHPVDNPPHFELGGYYPEAHGSLQDGNDVLQDVRNVIEAATTTAPIFADMLIAPAPPAAAAAAAGATGIQLDVDEVAAKGKVTVSAVCPSGGNLSVKLEVLAGATGQMKARQSLNRLPDGSYQATLDLARGVYRATVTSTAGARHVTRIFMVA